MSLQCSWYDVDYVDTHVYPARLFVWPSVNTRPNIILYEISTYSYIVHNNVVADLYHLVHVHIIIMKRIVTSNSIYSFDAESGTSEKQLA